MRNYLYNLATDNKKGAVAGVLKIFLFLLSLIYALILFFLRFFSQLRKNRYSCRIISVGNITWGGTGKTTLVAYIARYLKEKNYKIAIVSRGYKRKVKDSYSQVVNFQTIGDEPFMLLKKLEDIPIIVDKNREKAIEKAERAYFVDTVILDDGFQQWKIKKDLEIVTIDARNPFGNKHLIPRGIMREPFSSLKRADIFVLTKVNFAKDVSELEKLLKKINPRAEIFKAYYLVDGIYNLKEELIPLDYLREYPIGVFSGIADPQTFEETIKGLGLEIKLVFKFTDHHSYAQKDIDLIVKSSQQKNISFLLTTEKDKAKISSFDFKEIKVLYLRIKLSIENEERFNLRLLRIYSD